MWDTLDYNQGKMDVQSVVGQGTTIQLTFPRSTTATWIAQDIHLTPTTIIVILDDEESIHMAWNLRFSSLLGTYPTLRLHHFIKGQDVLDFLATLSQQEKERVMFLSDYELLQQERNGLQIIEASCLKSAMLVTSYYANSKVRDAAMGLNIKILPKQMASVVPIYA